MDQPTTVPSLFERMSALADLMRSRLLFLLERHELAVGELCAVLQLPQSTVSRHLKALGDDGWVASRAEGTSRRYRLATDRLDPAARRLWSLVQEQVSASPFADRDAERLGAVLAERRSRSQDFFRSAAGQWDRLRAELFGERASLQALLGLLPDDWTVADLGCGTGQAAAALAPFVGRVIAVDDSPEMLAAARRRLADLPQVEVRSGELSALPLDNGELDAAVLLLVLHHVVDPAAVLAEVGRVVRPGGRALVVDMTPHDRDDFRARMGHQWPGFGPEQVTGWLEDAGFAGNRYVRLPPDPGARGPTLFAATAARPRPVRAQEAPPRVTPSHSMRRKAS